MPGDPQQPVGVVGAGTMGAGIALTALRSGFPVKLTDVSQAALDQAQQYIQRYLNKDGAAGSAPELSCSTESAVLAGCQVVIEAALEDLELKRQLFAELDRICPPPAILASNTSTLSITAIAAATETAERVAGMHFFNPAPVMQLVEVVRGASTAELTVAALTELAERLGKVPVVTGDSPGFIVNRVARPFYGEALRLLGEGAASHAAIDTILKLGAGFRMGPFELMDLIGIDVNFAAANSIYQASFMEPRYRPHWIQQQKVDQGELGRKTGVGFYRYQDGEAQAEKPEPPERSQASGEVWLSPGSWAPGWGEALAQGGYAIRTVARDGEAEGVASVSRADAEGEAEGSPSAGQSPTGSVGELPLAVFALGGGQDSLRDQVVRLDAQLPAEVPIVSQVADCAFSALAASLSQPARLVGFDGLFAASGQAVTLVRSEATSAQVQASVERLVRTLGKLPLWISEAPGLVAPRVVCCLANEAAFAVGESVAESDQIDRAVVLGLNYPHGPLAWGASLGWDKVLEVLDHLRAEYGEERYRAAPLVRRWARTSPEVG